MRWFLFLLVILVGLAIGLYYGWVISPVEYVNTSPESLSIDYKADYVLMVAEVYAVESDLAWAQENLALIGELPVNTVNTVILAAEPYYQVQDLALMRQLLEDLQSVQETAAP